jgi:hypothetical protein
MFHGRIGTEQRIQIFDMKKPESINKYEEIWRIILKNQKENKL